MCLLPPCNGPGSARSVVDLVALSDLAVVKPLPLATGLGLSLTIGLLHPGKTMAQPIASEVAPLSASQSAGPVASASAQQLLFVSPLIGNDAKADGSQRSPFRTITQALQVAQPNTVILLTTGTYSIDTGEVFPLMLKPGVTLQGDPSTQGRGIVIRGGGAFVSPTSAEQNITILTANQTQLVGVTVTNPNPGSYGIWVESSNPVITDSTFTGNAHNSILIMGSSTPLLRNNRFDDNPLDHTPASGTVQVARSASIIQSPPPQVAVAPSPTTQVQARVSQVLRQPAAAIRSAPAITELPPSAISTLPPDAPQAGTPIAQSPPRPSSIPNIARPDAAAPIAVAPPMARSSPTTEMRMPSSTPSRAAIVPIAQPRSVQSATEISVPPASPILQPAIVSRTQDHASPANTVRMAAVTVPATTAVPSATPVALQTIASPRSSPALATHPAPDSAARTSVDSSRPVSATAIEIPVPPPAHPASSTTLAYAPRPASTLPASRFNAPIEIPVPLPESSAVAPAAVRSQEEIPSPPQQQNVTPSANLLPVPDGDAPIGNVGDLPRISVASTQTAGLYYASSQIPADLRYRVVVDASSAGTQSLVQSIVPNAFLTSVGGQTLMQVGAFNSRDNAERTVQMLNQNGLVAVIQEIE